VQVRFHRDAEAPDMNAPVLLAAWPGVGSVGIGTVDFIRRKLDAKRLADLDLRSHFTSDGVLVEDGLTRAFSDLPTHVFYSVPESGLILSQSEAQLEGKPGVEVMQAVIDFAQKVGVKTIYTAAALPATISFTQEPEVAVVVNREGLLESFEGHDVAPLEQGHISGMNGLLLGFAAARNIDAACLLGTMPQYAANLPNPKASREIIRRLGGILDLDVDLEEFGEAVEEMDSRMEEIEESIRSAFAQMDGIEESEFPPTDLDESDVPMYVMQKVERLFEEVGREGSKEKAAQLKEELDRWNLYPLYEDRFLNLFRRE
jgi:predicted ATP-grasp superfamily ATP-dependent carboligase